MIRSKIIQLVSNASVPKLFKNTTSRTPPAMIVQKNPSVGTAFRCYTNLPSMQDNEKHTESKIVKGEMQIAFTCTVCNTRNHRQFSKISYEKGIVIVECDGCKNNHLIADNLGWFPHTGCKNIEEILAAKGEKVKRMNGCWEITSQIVKNNKT